MRQRRARSDVIHAAALVAEALTPFVDADWTVRAATLDWSVERTVVHMIGGPAKYTLYLASRSPTFIAVTLPSGAPFG